MKSIEAGASRCGCSGGFRSWVPRWAVRLSLALALALTSTGCSFTDNRGVNLRPEHLACHTDDDCTYAGLRCSTCGDPVAKRFAAPLQEERDRLCRHYRGPMVDCPPPTAPMCEAGQCSATPATWDPRL